MERFFVFIALFILVFGVNAGGKLRVFLPSANPIEKAGFLVAEKKQLYAEEKLSVTFVEGNRADPLASLDYGLADIVQESLSIALQKSRKNPSYTLYAQLYQMPTTTIACIKPGPNNLKELQGKEIGYSNQDLLLTTKIWLGYLGYQMEGDAASYRFEKTDDLAESFSRGKLSCGIMERHLVPMVTAKTTSQLSYFSPSFENGAVLTDGLYVNDKVLQDDGFRRELDLFLKVSENAWRYVFEHKEDFYSQILDQKTKEKLPLEVALRMIALLEDNFDLKNISNMGSIPYQKINYSIMNMLSTSQYSGITDRPHGNFLLKPSN